MNLQEWKERHGAESAAAWFGTDGHLVFVVKPGRLVFGTCGNWKGSEPLGNKARNPDVDTAKQRIRDSLAGFFTTEETIIDD